MSIKKNILLMLYLAASRLLSQNSIILAAILNLIFPVYILTSRKINANCLMNFY